MPTYSTRTLGEPRQAAFDGDVQPSDVGNPNAGIICPWNKDDTGRAKMRVHCLVWKNWLDFSDWGAEGGFYFCRVHCQYGRNPEAANRARGIRARYSGILPAWFRQMAKPFTKSTSGRRVA